MRYLPDRCRLLEWYKESGISQREVSIITGISDSHLSDYAHNRRTMSLPTLMTVAMALKMENPIQLYTWKTK
ncbi:helix-turn-helix domain-containing protein [Paenibacillus daejeonensis]|uniref:helix-turn-helix domain-containing protein n=1 Tax=Paenibacillus daejeonensis TaxID=135193 RepID=UPI001B7FA78A